MEFGIVQPIFTHNKHPRLYGTMKSILYNTEGKNVAVIHVYGDRVIFLLFCVHQDTEYE